MAPFQLFPPPSPDPETKASRIPIRKGHKPGSFSSSSTPLQEIKSSNEMDARRMTKEDEVRIQPPRKVHVKSNSESVLGLGSRPAWTLRSVNHDDDRALSNASSSSTLGNHGSTQIPAPSPSSSDIPLSQRPQPSTSKLPPFRHKPLPQRPGPGPGPRPQPRPRGLTLSPEPQIDRDLGPKTVPASVMNFPAGIRDSVEMRESSNAELGQLWDVANGQRMEGGSGLGRVWLRLVRYALLYLLYILYSGWLVLTVVEPGYQHSHSETITTPSTPSPSPQTQTTNQPPCQ